MGLEASELARWTRFAAKGGIGKCTATCDCVAESTDDLMFLKDDEITVLLQLPDKENLFLGYCEGVVGHFSGSDVHFHAKLKVPVKAKRASTIEKSPPPSSDTTSPIGRPSSRRSSTSKTEAEALDRRASQQRRVLISSRMQSMEDEPQRYPPSLTFSSSSTGTDSVVTTPALGYFSSPEIKKSSINGTPASSPRDPNFLIEAPRSKSMPPTRTSSPPTMSVSHSHAAMVPTVHRKNTPTPNLTPESTIPLRINKRTPTSPSVPRFSPNPVSQPPPSVSDTSYSTCNGRSDPQSVKMSDVEVGIGLSLLQDLANGIDSDSDDGDDQWPKPDQHGSAAGTPDLDPYAAALSRVGHRRDGSGEGTQESTVEGLGYALSDDDYEKRELAGPGKHAVIVEDTPSQTPSAVTTRRASLNPSIYSNSNASTSRNPNIFLPSSTSPISPSFSHSSSPTNERRPSMAPSASSGSEWEGASDIYDDYRYSRYSMASKMSRFSSSAGWTGSAPLTPPLPDSSSIGRARTDSSKSRPDSCARSRTDSMNTRSNVDSSSTSSEMKAVNGGSLLSFLPLLAEASEMGGQEPQGSQEQDDLHSKRAIMKKRTMSMESAASVYTQNSCLSAFSQEAISPGSNANNHVDTPPTYSNANGKTPSATNARPTSLSLPRSDVVKSPLLQTTWVTPLSSAIDGSSSAATESSDLRTPMVGTVGGGARAGVGIPLGLTEEGRRKGSSDMMISGSFGHGVNGVGIASALRQRLETERRSATPEQTQNQRLNRNSSVRKSYTQSDGLGHGIVVEDDDELPSRILDNSGSTFMSLTVTMSPEPMYDEDEEEEDINEDPAAGDHDRRSILSSPDLDSMMLRTHLAPLTIANRTPSPSVFDGGSDDVRGSRTVAEVENEDEVQEREERMAKGPSPIIPTTPPVLNGSSSAPPPQASISPPPPQNPALPRLSSASTIRIGSPSIDIRPPLALSDIREPGGPLLPGSNQRQSLFLPHPNAPKSLRDGVVSVAGLAGPDPGVPMYIAAQQQGGWARGPGGMMLPARPSVIGVIRMALSAPPRVAMVRGQGPSGQGEQGFSGQRSPLMMPMRGPTIYGRTEVDLVGSLVPVPIMFSIDPPHVAPHPSNPIPTYLAPPSQGTTTSKPVMPSSPPRSPMQSTTKQQPHSEPQQHPLRSPSLSTPAGARAAAVGASESNVGPSAGEGDVTPAEPKAGVIPRPNFSPKSPRMRPRSRSFSCSTNGVPQQIDEAEIPSKDVKRSLSISLSSSSNLASSPSGQSKSKLASIRLPPLSLPHLKSTLRSPISPLAQSNVPPVPISPNHLSIGMGNRSQHQLRRETSSRSALNEALPSPSRPIPISRPTIPRSTIGNADSPPPSSPSQSLSHTASIHAQSRNDSSSRASDADAASINSDTRSHLAVVRQLSLRTKLSLPNLRRNRSRQEDDSVGGDGDMLQVKDTEFQLVTPNFAHFQSNRPSDDSGVLAKDVDVRQDGNAFLRAESPAISNTSKQSPLSEFPATNSWSPLSPSTPSRATTDPDPSMEAHRNRETKWMSLMSSSPASQARKSKKVRKLIMDGVPSSVRYLVWSYLTDGKARCVPGVYAQLCSRGRVPSSAEIERDIKNCFQDQPHLQGTQCPVLLLLQAYLNMVPDILYTMGLTLIVGQLLLLAPEEDAFWIFISIMDTHIRPYFSTVTTQMEVDSALFSRALENNDQQVARKVLVDLGITPLTICQPWFSSLFVGTLPPEYLNRVWDLFLFEGIPFLLRVALAIVTCCRVAILESTSEETVLEIFRHPPQSLLPTSPDAFLSLVCSIKLKDDDVRKQRIKMEAQVKRQTQVPRTISAAGGISLPRT